MHYFIQMYVDCLTRNTCVISKRYPAHKSFLHHLIAYELKCRISK